MLQIITGRAGSGKSEWCFTQIEKLAQEGRNSVIIVPEQSSYAVERNITLRLGSYLSARCEIKSFKSLCTDIFAECGGLSLRIIDDAVRCTLVRRAVMTMPSEIVCFRRHKRDMSFYKLCVSLIEEFKNVGVTPQDLLRVLEHNPSELSRLRMQEIARIYERYEMLLGTRYMDSASQITAAAERCSQSRQFFDKTIFLDDFTGFTAPQFSMITSLMRLSTDVHVTLCCDTIDDDRQDAFTSVRKCGHHLQMLAAKFGIPCTVASLTGSFRFHRSGLTNLEGFLLGKQIHDETAGIYHIAGGDRYQEIAMVADEILYLVRERKYAYHDIIVVSRDNTTYRAAIERSFTRYGIPFFSDNTRTMLFSSPSVFILSAIDIAVSFTTEKLLTLLKTSLCDLNDDMVCLLENYAYIWNLDRKAWQKPFQNNPRGMAAEMDDLAREELEALELARQKIYAWIRPLLSRTKDTGSLLKSVYGVMRQCGLLDKLAGSEETVQREASAALEMLDSLYNLFAGDEASAAEVLETARLLAESNMLGDVPSSLDQVTVGTAERMRFDDPKIVFAIGLNEGIFPRTSFDSPLLTSWERDLLAKCGMELTRSYENAANMEQLYIYRALTSASERVYLSYAQHSQKGSALSPNSELSAFLDHFTVSEPETKNDPARFIVNDPTALDAYATADACSDQMTKNSLSQAEGPTSLPMAEIAALPPVYHIYDSLLTKKSIGHTAVLSASRIDTFQHCRFQYFLRYMLGVQPIRKAEISPLEAGNFVHAILENTLRELGSHLQHASKEEIAACVGHFSDIYIENILGTAAQTMPRILYLVGRLRQQSIRLIMQIQKEQNQSAFHPCDFELEIAPHGDIQPLTLRTATGETVMVVGKIDRVDIFQKDGESYIRIVDYKTGTKSFSLSDVYYGLSIQMPLYLFTITQNGQSRYGDINPAGVLYLPSDPVIPSEKTNLARELSKVYRMDGLVIDNEDILQAMDRDISGLFIPVTKKKDGSFTANKVASLARLGNIASHINKIITDMASALYAGSIEALPIEQSNRLCCEYCDYATVCRSDRIADKRVITRLNEKTLFQDGTGGEEVGTQLDGSAIGSN